MVTLNKKYNIAIVGFNDLFFRDMAIDLNNRKDINISHAFGIFKKDIQEWEKKLHNSMFFSYESLIKQDVPINGSDQYPLFISDDLFKQFQHVENDFYSMTDRFAYFPISHEKRRNLFYDCLLFWYFMLEKEKIDFIIFQQTPHLAYDFILYHVAKYYKIPVLFTERTLINERISLVETYEKISKVPETFLSEMDIDSLKKDIGKELSELLFKESFWIKAAKKQNKSGNGQSPVVTFLKQKFNTLKNIFRVDLLKASNAEHFLLNRKMNNFTVNILKEWNKINISAYRKYYQSLTTDCRDDQKFVYFPLQFQPERTTLPLGGYFKDQLLAIRILSQSLPPDVKIYVKEHPRQFLKPNEDAIHVRSKSYYDKIVELKNVKLIDFQMSNSKLLEKSIFISTITGSAGWEAMLTGKPCMVFGTPWYVGCNSCYNVNDIDSCKSVYKEMVEKSKKEVLKDLLRYVAFNKSKWVVTANRYDMAIKSKNSYKTLVTNLSDAVYQKICSVQSI